VLVTTDICVISRIEALVDSKFYVILIIKKLLWDYILWNKFIVKLNPDSISMYYLLRISIWLPKETTVLESKPLLMTRNALFNLKLNQADRQNWVKNKTNNILPRNTMYDSKVRLLLLRWKGLAQWAINHRKS